jgi:predicted transcriptional regulator
MVNEIKKNSEVILKYLDNDENVTLTELTNKIKLSRGQIRVAVAFLLGAEKISEFKVGMAKVYNIK